MKKQNVQFVFDVLLVRKYKKQIILANFAGVALMVLYTWTMGVREDRKLKQLYGNPETTV